MELNAHDGVTDMPDPHHVPVILTCSRYRKLVRQGITDINQIKAVTRAGMGACGSKTCETIIRSVLRQEGIPQERVTPNTRRPVFVEVWLGVLAGMSEGNGNGQGV